MITVIIVLYLTSSVHIGNHVVRDVVLESMTWTRVRLESRFLGLGLGLETCGLALGLRLATCGLGLRLGLDTSGLETWT